MKHTAGPRMNLETTRRWPPERRRMIAEPGEEIQVHHRCREQVGRDNGIPRAIQRQWIGGGFGAKRVEGHKRLHQCPIHLHLATRKVLMRF